MCQLIRWWLMRIGSVLCSEQWHFISACDQNGLLSQFNLDVHSLGGQCRPCHSSRPLNIRHTHSHRRVPFGNRRAKIIALTLRRACASLFLHLLLTSYTTWTVSSPQFSTSLYYPRRSFTITSPLHLLASSQSDSRFTESPQS